MNRLSFAPDTSPTLLFNPTLDDFRCSYNGADYTLPAKAQTAFPKYLADHLAKHLARKLALEEEPGLHFEDRLAAWKEKIYVKL